MKEKTEPEEFDYIANPDTLPDYITEDLSPEEIEEVMEIVKGCRQSWKRDPEGSASLAAAIERACIDENM